MKLIDEKFASIRGEYKLYTVRSNRHTGCFMIVDRLRNFVLADGFTTRESAWEYLREERPAAELEPIKEAAAARTKKATRAKLPQTPETTPAAANQ